MIQPQAIWKSAGNKDIYIEAENEEKALDDEMVSSEMGWGCQEFEYEAHEASVRELDKDEEERTRRNEQLQF